MISSFHRTWLSLKRAHHSCFTRHLNKNLVKKVTDRTVALHDLDLYTMKLGNGLRCFWLLMQKFAGYDSRTSCIRIFLSAHWKVGSKCMKHPQTDQFFAALSMHRNPPWFSFSEWATNFGPLMAGWLKAYPQEPQPEIDVGVWPFWSTKFGAAGTHEIARLQNLPNYPGSVFKKFAKVSNSGFQHASMSQPSSPHLLRIKRSLLPRGKQKSRGPTPAATCGVQVTTSGLKLGPGDLVTCWCDCERLWNSGIKYL